MRQRTPTVVGSRTDSSVAAAPVSDGRTRRNLTRALARHCRGATVVVEMDADSLTSQLRARGIAAEAAAGRQLVDPDSGPTTAPTVLLAAIEQAPSSSDVATLIERAWQRVAAGGRLIVTVPNPDAWPPVERNGDRMTRPRLTRVLRTFGEPRLITEQPYRWLTMVVRKTAPGTPRLKRPRRDRYAVTAGLCRGRVIELGCGSGDLAAVIAARGHAVVGVDISARKIAVAQRAFPELEFVVTDIRSVDFPDETFDTAVLAEVLEHVDADAGATILARAWRLVKPGGRLVVSVPNEDCVPHRNHVREFDRAGLSALLRPFGKPKPVADQPFKWLLMYVTKRT